METLNPPNDPKTVEEAIDRFMGSTGEDGYDYDALLAWLKKNPDKIIDSSFELKDRFQEGDNTGFMLVAQMLQKALVPEYKPKDPYSNPEITDI